MLQRIPLFFLFLGRILGAISLFALMILSYLFLHHKSVDSFINV